ncbi:Rhomboid [Parelaphostrongylus tenuis]|uniref:Rhomboid n=1 Tax=Parelaphostrongylus tenuis TaxID=148309 RepID=A0AAD5MZB6_PARTN|nr:Rhomboid [Parelaphostrongylus tenuis]
MSRPDLLQSAKISAEGLLRRTGSTIEEEPPSDISDDHEPIGDMSQSRFSGQIQPTEAEEFEMLEMEKPSLDDVTHQAKSPSPISSQERSSVNKYENADDLFFAFSSDDDPAPAKPAQEAERKRHLSAIICLGDVGALSTDTDAPRRDRHGGISRLDLGDGRLHIPVGPVSLGPVPGENQTDTQTDRPLLDHFKNLVRIESFVTHCSSKPQLWRQARRPLFERVLGNLGRYNGRLFLTAIRALAPEVREIIEIGSDERPLFTWWVTSVQVLVCIVSLMFYGLGPIGWERVEMKGEVIDVSLIMRQVSYYEPVNHWIGPRFADLIRLGAKYSPCMRREPELWELIEEERRKENVTGCCVFNDRTGCYQTRQSSCPHSLATWHKWFGPTSPSLTRSKSDSSLLNTVLNATASRRRRPILPVVSSHSWRTAGAVCGQDPDFCKRPSSVRPYEWPDDLTRWPICEEPRQGAFLPAHMTCQVTGRPCCIQMQGQCRIATREYCDFVKGHYHENATLCSQVNCFSDICGMLPFLWRDRPDQFYRMFLSLFLHAGIIHCAFTVFVQMWLMLDLEMLIGWKRMAILYIGSGIGGNFASAIFVPYSPEVGPSGSHLGIMAALVVDLHHHRHIIVRPRRELMKHMLTVFMLFLTGLLPWIDNWAHLFGFVFGLLITIVTFPYLDFKSDEKLKLGCYSSSRRHVCSFIHMITFSRFGFVIQISHDCLFSACNYNGVDSVCIPLQSTWIYVLS